MTGWIKMRKSLHSDPAVLQISSATGLDIFGVVGRLHWLWSWFDEHTESGNAVVTLDRINELLRCTHFAQQMQIVGWLREENGVVSVPKFDRHNSQSAKRRALTARRVETHRRYKCNANALPEKRREEKNITVGVPTVMAASDDANESNKQKKKTATKTITADDLAYPAEIDTPEVRQAIGRWIEYKAGRSRERYRDGGASLNRKLSAAARYGSAAVVEAIDHAIASTYKGFFVGQSGASSSTRSDHTANTVAAVKRSIEQSQSGIGSKLDSVFGKAINELGCRQG